MIVLQGIPGCGKTTLTREIGARERIPIFLEDVGINPYLDLYYTEPTKYAFPMQVLLLSNNLKNMQKAQVLPRCVVDTSVYTNDIFVTLQHNQGYLTDLEYQTYMSLSRNMQETLETPDLLVYLECSPSTAVQRILKRNRSCELNASIDYWSSLQKLNHEFYENYTKGKKLLINVDNIDIVDDESDLDYIIDCIMQELS